MKLQNLLPLVSLVSGLIVAAPVAQANDVQCKQTSEWHACFTRSGSYSIRLRDGNGMEGQCGSGANRSNGFPFAIASQIHYNFCGTPLDVN